MLSREFVHRIAKSEVAPAKAEVDSRPHELTNIRVEEVSLVDKPANKRGFIVKKRGKKTDTDALVLDADEVIDLTQTAKGEAPGADLDRADAEKDKAAKEAAAVLDAEREKTIAAKAEAEPPPEKKDEPAESVEKPAETPPEEKQVDGPDKVEETGTAKAETEEAPVEKVGRKMSRARIDRLKAGLKQLQDLLTEVGEPAEGDEGEAAAKAEEAPVTVKAEEKSSEAKSAENTDAVIAAAVNKALEASNGQIAQLKSMIEGLSKVVKEQGAQLDRSRMPVDSNTISLEKSELHRDNLVWPVDMASPEARLKGRSF